MAARKEIGNVDAALEKLGPYGKYSLLQFFTQEFAQVAIVHHMLSIVFTGQKNPFSCPTSSFHNESSQTGSNFVFNASGITFNDVCQPSPFGETDSPPSNTSSCNAYNVKHELPKDRFFTSEFDLVCDREYLAAFTQTLLTLGHAIGTLAFPYFADNYGRKPILLICSFLWLGSALGLAFSVNYIMFAIFKTLVGVFLQGVSQTSLTVMAEVLTAQQRGFLFGCLSYVLTTMSMMWMAAVAYLLRDHSWRVLELTFCVYFVYIIFYVFIMDEPLRWLAANGFQERVTRVLKRASKWNGCNLDSVLSAFYQSNETATLEDNTRCHPLETGISKSVTDACTDKGVSEGMVVHQQELAEAELFKDPEDIEKLNFLSLIMDKTLRFHTAFCTLAWFFNNLTYFALFLMSSTLSGSLYLNYFLNCAAELPSAIFIYFYIDRLGRRTCFAAFSIIAGISLVGVAITAAVSHEMTMVIKVLAIVGKFGISGSFSTLFTLTPELFPTNVRNTAQGLTSLSACLGGMLAPFAEMLMTKAVYAPGLIFGTGSLVLSAWACFLPETARRQLPQTLKDIKKWLQEPKRRRKRFFCFVSQGKHKSTS